MLHRKRARKCTGKKKAKQSNCFAVYCKLPDGREGFLRFRSGPMGPNRAITFLADVTERFEDASKFTNMKSQRDRLDELKTKWGLLEAKSFSG